MPAIPSGHLITRLRSLMQSSCGGRLSAYIVPSSDAHQSEYLAECDKRREFMSKFTGSSGTAIITHDQAVLWTDGRYHLQASQELDPQHWKLLKDGLPETPTQSEWLKQQLESDSKVGADPFLVSHEAWSMLSKELGLSNISLVPVGGLVDSVWDDESILKETDTRRSNRPSNKVTALSEDIAGKGWVAKVTELRQEITKKNVSGIVLHALDEIAWLLNLRGSDIDYNPVFFSYCLVTMKEVILFIDKEKLSEEATESIRATEASLEDATQLYVRIMPYDGLTDHLQKTHISEFSEPIWMDNKCPRAIIDSVSLSKCLISPSPVAKLKAIKNATEIQNMKNCHIRDAAALCEYLAWLEETIEANPDGHDSLWEIAGADYLEKCRSQQYRFKGLSFPSISSSGPNGAIIHYHPAESTNRPIGKKELYLIDSGAQYLDGTTDVTRTVHFGTPTDKERECFTLVLKGHIQLALSIFPRLTKGSQLDGFARRHLWAKGLNYLHGTGHGVGMYLNVHEGPSSISPRTSPADPGLEAGQVLSNEPGYYEDGQFGIRIENLVITKKVETQYNFANEGYLGFETITLVPIQLKMIDKSLLTDEEIDWLNEYHANCRELVGEHLDKMGKQTVKKWLIKETEKLARN